MFGVLLNVSEMSSYLLSNLLILFAFISIFCWTYEIVSGFVCLETAWCRLKQMKGKTMLNHETLRETIKAYRDGEYDKDRAESAQKIRKLWYDWFCKDSSLTNKGRSLLQKLNQIADSKKINMDKTYVWFKNNCPCNGCLYDDFRISDIESGDVIFTITPKSGHKCDKGKAQLYGQENGFEAPIVEGTWKDIKDWFRG